MLVDDGEGSSSSSPRSSLDLVVYPPPMHHERSEETTAFLSNQESDHDTKPLKLQPIAGGELEAEDLEAGPSTYDRGNATQWNRLKSFIRQLYTDNIGLLLIVASQGFFACMDFFVKLLTALDKPVPALELIWIRMFITYICCMTYMLFNKIEYPWTGPPGVRGLLVIRGVSGFFGLIGIYYSLQYLTLSDATVLTFLAPTLTGVVSYFLLKEPFSRKQALAGLFSLFGVVLIARPASLFGHGDKDGPAAKFSSEQRLAAVGVSLLGVVGSAGAYTSMRAIGTKAHILHSLNYFSIYCVVVSTILMLALRVSIVVPADWLHILFIFLIGIFGFVAQILLVTGFQNETASRGSMAIYTLILFSGSFEQIFLHVKLAALSVIGGIIIISSAIYVAVTKQRPPDDKPAPKQVRWVEDVNTPE